MTKEEKEIEDPILRKAYYEWVKKIVSKREWKNKYSEMPAYCFLKQNRAGIEVGFLSIFDKVPDHLAYCDDEDMRIIDIYYKANNIFPEPFTKDLEVV